MKKKEVEEEKKDTALDAVETEVDRKAKCDQIMNDLDADKITATVAFTNLVEALDKSTMVAILQDGLNREMSGEPLETIDVYMTLSEYKEYKDRVWKITKFSRQVQKMATSQQKALWAEAKKYPEVFTKGEPFGLMDEGYLVNFEKAKHMDDKEIADIYPKVEDKNVIDNVKRMQKKRDKGEEMLADKNEEFVDWLFELCDKKGYRGTFPPMVDEDGKIRAITQDEVEKRQRMQARM